MGDGRADHLLPHQMVVDGKALVAGRIPVRDVLNRVAGSPGSPTPREEESGSDGRIPPPSIALTRAIATSVSALGGTRTPNLLIRRRVPPSQWVAPVPAEYSHNR